MMFAGLVPTSPPMTDFELPLPDEPDRQPAPDPGRQRRPRGRLRRDAGPHRHAQPRRASGGGGGSTLRLFVAAYPPTDLAEHFLERLRRLPVSQYRETPLAQIHLTLHFIGEVSARELDQVVDSVGRATVGIRSFELMPLRLLSMPPGRRPARLVAVETTAPGVCSELHRRLAVRFARKPRVDPADRFLPHLTLCRFDKDANEPAVAQDLTPEPGLNPFPVDRIHLVKSALRPSGAVHEVVRTYPLE